MKNCTKELNAHEELWVHGLHGTSTPNYKSQLSLHVCIRVAVGAVQLHPATSTQRPQQPHVRAVLLHLANSQW